jgi:MbtH protein
MTNPFEDNDSTYIALVNDENQYSLWPETIEVPSGWQIAYSGGRRQDALAYIEEHWTDMRPRSLVVQMEANNKHPTTGPAASA